MSEQGEALEIDRRIGVPVESLRGGGVDSRPLVMRKDPTGVVVRAYLRAREAGAGHAEACDSVMARVGADSFEQVQQLLVDASRHRNVWPDLAELIRTPSGSRKDGPVSSGLPDPETVLRNAQGLLSKIYALAGDCGDELRSDVSVPWTAEQAEQKRQVFAALAAIKEQVNGTR